MMESYSTMTKNTTMKTNSTEPGKEIFNDSFFIRRPIVAEGNSEQLKNSNEQTSFAFSYIQSQHSMKANSTQGMNLSPAAIKAGDKISTYLQNGKVNHSPFVTPSEARGITDHSPHKKTAFMKKFLRNHFVIAI